MSVIATQKSLRNANEIGSIETWGEGGLRRPAPPQGGCPWLSGICAHRARMLINLGGASPETFARSSISHWLQVEFHGSYFCHCHIPALHVALTASSLHGVWVPGTLNLENTTRCSHRLFYLLENSESCLSL